MNNIENYSKIFSSTRNISPKLFSEEAKKETERRKIKERVLIVKEKKKEMVEMQREFKEQWYVE